MDLKLIYLDRVILVSLTSFVFCSFFSISLTQISCSVGGLAWAIKCFVNRSWGMQRFPLKVPFLFFVFACILGVASSPDISESYKSLKRLLEILIFFWAVNCIESEELREKLSLLLIFAASISTLTSFYGVWENGRHLFDATMLQGNYRAQGNMSVYMTFAGLLMLSLLVASGKLFFAPKENKWIYLSFILIAACLLLTFTRQAWLGVFAGGLFLIWFREKKMLWSVPLILIIVFAISPATIQWRIKTLLDLNDPNLKRRIALWDGGWLIFQDHFLTGCGFKCVDAVNHKYPDPTGIIKRLRGMHNNFIQLAVDTGLFGLISWVSIWVIYFMTLYHSIISMKKNLAYKRDAMASAAAITGFLVAGFFETNFYDSEVSMLMYFIMALPFTANWKNLAASEKRNPETISPRI